MTAEKIEIKDEAGVRTERPPISNAMRAVDVDDEQFRLSIRSGTMALIFHRRQRRGGGVDRVDVADYEALCAILEKTK